MNTQRTSSIIAALAATLALGLASTAAGVAPAAAVGNHSPVPVSDSISSGVDEVEEPATFGEVHGLIVQLHADGQVTRFGDFLLRFHLEVMRRIYLNGGCSPEEEQWVRDKYFEHVESFREVASDPQYVRTESARVQLLTAADQLAQLCVVPEASQ